MAGMYVSAESVLNQLRLNLQDRYLSGFPVVKELIQNADDARAQRLHFLLHSGWLEANNPLLRWPGLAVLDDGFFGAANAKGIVSFAQSSKAGDKAAVGRFGFGQKAVFNLCDAFIFCADGTTEPENPKFPYRDIVNPFEEVEVSGNIAPTWSKQTLEMDLSLLQSLAEAEGFSGRRLLQWFPFRRLEIAPAPGAYIFNKHPTISEVREDIDQPRELVPILAMLRHVREITVAVQTGLLTRISVGDGNQRFRGAGLSDPAIQPQLYTLTLTTGSGDGSRTEAFATGLERTSNDPLFHALRRHEAWPRGINARTGEPEPEKGEAHGAAALIRMPGDDSLRVGWAVFLPTAGEDDVQMPLPKGLGSLRLVLHGYFFLDSGRRRIDGLREPGSGKPLSPDAAPQELSRTWNRVLRDKVTLPLIPALLHEALQQERLKVDELTAVVRALVQSDWYLQHRAAIAVDHVLARVLRNGQFSWALLPSDVQLRALPASFEQDTKRVGELLPNLGAWAKARGLELVIDGSTALASEVFGWTAEEVASAMRDLPARAFQSDPLGNLLGDWLDLALGGRILEGPSTALHKAFRAALIAEPNHASEEVVRRLLRYVQRPLLLTMPSSATARPVFRAMAESTSEILPARPGWLSVDRPSLQSLGVEDASALLMALGPIIEQDHSTAEPAAVAALTVLQAATRYIPRLLRNEATGAIPVLRARDERLQKQRVLSLTEAANASDQKRLFARSGNTPRLVGLVRQAIPEGDLFTIDSYVGSVLKEEEFGIRATDLNRERVLGLIRSARRFGEPKHRAALLPELRPFGAPERDALRALCAGLEEAAEPDYGLFFREGDASPLDDFIERFLRKAIPRSAFIHADVAGDVLPREKGDLGVRRMDLDALSRHLDHYSALLSTMELTRSECELLISELPDDGVVRKLEVHERMDESRGSIHAGLFRIGAVPVPSSLASTVEILKPAGHEGARQRQERLVPCWTARDQVRQALDQPEPHRFWQEILDGLERVYLTADDPLTLALKTTPWLTISGRPFAPRDLFCVPDTVEVELRRLLSLRQVERAWAPTADLPTVVCEHPGFEVVRSHILPGSDESYELLRLVIEAEQLTGPVSRLQSDHIRDLQTIAKSGLSLPLIEWPLLAAILLDESGPRQHFGLCQAFQPLREPEVATDILNTLAHLAREGGQAGEAARRLYIRDFAGVSTWPREMRDAVFENLLVLTKSGTWRSAREVAREDESIAQTHVLHSELSRSLRSSAAPGTTEGHPADASPLDWELSSEERPTKAFLKAADIEEESSVCLRHFVQPWCLRVPAPLLVLFIGLLGRYSSLRDLAAECLTDANEEVEAIWEDLDRFFMDEEVPGLSSAVERRRNRIRVVEGRNIKARNLMGEEFDAQLFEGTSALVVGNLHEHRFGVLNHLGGGALEPSFTVQFRDPGIDKISSPEAIRVLSETIETIIVRYYERNDDRSRRAIARIIKHFAHTDQASIKAALHYVTDQLPSLLRQLKLESDSKAYIALKRFEEEDHRLLREAEHQGDPTSPDRLVLAQNAKDKLQRTITSSSEALVNTLTALRRRIRDYGYGSPRVLFELFQNADDAYAQATSVGQPCRFRVTLDEGRAIIRVFHWGRLINQRGRDADGQDHGRDLQNMLLLNFSDKVPETGVTGQFGLGFKSIHLIADEVGVASGFNAIIIRGGLFPTEWAEGYDLVEQYRSTSRHPATLIECRLNPAFQDPHQQILSDFRAALPFLPAFARHIRRIDMDGPQPEFAEATNTPLLGQQGLTLFCVKAAKEHRGILFDLGDGFSLLLLVDRQGPCSRPESVQALWNLAPLSVEVESGWLLNGAFRVDPGRVQLGGTPEEQHALFQKLGQTLGERLLQLYSLCEAAFTSLADALDLEDDKGEGRSVFWTQLVKAFRCDLNDRLARHLHIAGGALARLLSTCPVIPTGLPAPLDGLIAPKANAVVLTGLLAGTAFELVRGWPELKDMRGRAVHPSIADLLGQLGLSKPKPFSLGSLLRVAIGPDRKVTPEIAERIGKVINFETLLRDLISEHSDLTQAVKDCYFLAEDGQYRPVKDLLLLGRDPDEDLRASFAPLYARLSGAYLATGQSFFQAARAQSGHNPSPRLLAQWARDAKDDKTKQAVLWYIVAGKQGDGLASQLMTDLPTWLPAQLSELQGHRWTTHWIQADRDKLVFALGGKEALVSDDLAVSTVESERASYQADAGSFFHHLYRWWVNNRDEEIRRYEKDFDLEFFKPEALAGDGSDEQGRIAWFTILSLACFQNIGRTRDPQHKSFLERLSNQGIWRQIALSQPPDDFEPWQQWLNQLSSAEGFRQDFLPWQRTLPDLYTIARWLPQYVAVLRRLPRITSASPDFPIREVVAFTYSPNIGGVTDDAAPLDRSLGTGLNWLLRELQRRNVLPGVIPDAFCWGATKRVRDLLLRVRCDIGEDISAETSRVIWATVREHLGDEKGRFEGDYDLALQLITLDRNSEALEEILRLSAPDDFDEAA